MASVQRDLPIFVSGHRGMVGSALVRRLERAGFSDIHTAARQELDLRDQSAVDAWFDRHRPACVIHAAGTVGGILANSTRPADFIHDNLLIQATVMRAAWQAGTSKLLYLSSSCVYPRDCPQPMREEHLLSGPLEKTNEGYALAKIAGMKSCEAYRAQHGCNFIAAMPTNLYGPHDKFELKESHVLAALIRKFHDARRQGDSQVTIWGTGAPRREFMHVDDLADACLFLLENYDEPQAINVGTGEDVTIRELAETVRAIIYPEVELTFDSNMPDGTPRKLLDVHRLHDLGWRHSIQLREGIAATYDWFCNHQPDAAT